MARNPRRGYGCSVTMIVDVSPTEKCGGALRCAVVAVLNNRSVLFTRTPAD